MQAVQAELLTEVSRSCLAETKEALEALTSCHRSGSSYGRGRRAGKILSLRSMSPAMEALRTPVDTAGDDR